ncbi:MAG: TlpA family protein disulfide reductase [Planctomycetes bacterium]|nr:TlpA family protein disulfide reductase [Planctomycetota bacterium]
MKYCLLLCLALIAAPVNADRIKVVDDTGEVVKHCETMWHTADSGYSRWQVGDGMFFDGLPNDVDVIDVVVRADNYATEVRRFAGDSLADLRAGKATITLHRGEEVQLKLNVPDGMDVPGDFLPRMYFPQFAGRVRLMCLPVNLRNGRVKPDFNMLNVSRISDRLYSFRLSRERTTFLVAFQHPGWLQFHEVGPLSNLDVGDGVLEIDVPRPVTIQVTLETGAVNEALLPIKDALVGVHWPNPNMDGSLYFATWDERIKPGETRTFSDFGPGRYMITIRTIARDGVENVAGARINPGQFYARREISLLAGVTRKERIQWTPFDPNAKRGDCNARLKLLMADGRPAAGVPVKVHWFDGHYGELEVHDGQTPRNGIVQLHGITSVVAMESPSVPYRVRLDGEYIGSFRLHPITDIQEFEFRMAPNVGDQAPDIDILEVDTGKAQRLSDYQGHVVLLEFWATWCGPCQPAMKKLNSMATENPDWADKVVIIPLSVDKTSELAANHVAQRGWTAMRHFWSRRVDDGQSQAEQAFVVHGIPTAILLKPDGTIAWRGHPMAKYSGGINLRDRIAAVLGEE